MSDRLIKVQVSLPLLLWREDGQFVAFTPALDLSTCGNDEEDAIRNFSEAVELFFETVLERNTVQDVLESLGWRLQKDSWIPSSQAIEGSRAFTAQVPLPEIRH